MRESSPGRGNRFFSSPKRPDRFCGLPSLLFNGYRGSFPGIELPSTAEVRNEYSNISAPQYAFIACAGTTLPFSLIIVYMYVDTFFNLVIAHNRKQITNENNK